MESKSRILHILKYLWLNTDDEHSVTTTDILIYLKSENITCDRKTLPVDIKKLCQFGFDIEEERRRENHYSLSNHLFTLPEVKLLIDAVESSKVITTKKSFELTEKLSRLTSLYQAAELKRNIYISDRVKPLNEQIYYLIDSINTAINSNRQISFKYFHYDQNRNEVPSNAGKSYFFSPYCLVWNNDHYYAIGYSEKHSKITTFRIDHMKNVNILSLESIQKPDDFNLRDFTRQVFDMYDGPIEKVTLCCTNEMMNYIIDKFGAAAEITPIDHKHFSATTDVSVSKTFFGWVFQFNGDIKILFPSSVVEKYSEMLKNAIK